MWVSLFSFLLVPLACCVLVIFLIRGGRNHDDDIGAGGRRRALLFGSLTAALAGILPCPAPTRKKLAQFLRHAGHYHRHALSEFLALRNTLVVGWVLLAATALVVIPDPRNELTFPIIMGGLVVAILLFTLPRLFLELIGHNRVQRIEESLPDALDMATMCMSGGVPLQSALVRVSDEMQSIHPDLAFELRVVGRQMEAASLDMAVRQFAARIEAPEVQSLAAILGQTERQGSGVAAAFELFADNVRLNRRQRSEEAGNKTAVKLLFPLVFCLAPPVYLMLLAPAAMELSDFVQRERKPGGALSASAESVSPLLEKSSVLQLGASPAPGPGPASAPGRPAGPTRGSRGPRLNL
jgi:tight adherence protein C